MNDSAKFVVHERTSVDAYQRLCSRPDVIRGQIRAVCKLDIDQVINRNSRVSGKLDKGVEGESQAVVQFVCQVLKETRVVNCNVQGKVGTINEISILPDGRNNFIAGFTDRRTAVCLGVCCHQQGTLNVTTEFGLYHLSIIWTAYRISLWGDSALIKRLHFQECL